MRLLFILSLLTIAISLQAQTTMPLGTMGYTPGGTLNHFNSSNFNDSTHSKKWFVSTYVGMSTSISFFKGGNATVVAVPFVLQLNQRLSNNWYAFAAVSAAPAYVNFNGSYLSPGNNKTWQNNNFLKSSRAGIYSRAEMGLMYVNEAKTFSISGSIGIEKSSYPMPYYPLSTIRPNAASSPNR